MKQFLFKEFIKYNGPCIGCQSKINIEFNVRDKNKPDSRFKIKCLVTKDYTDVSLKISYNNSIRLKILHKNNTFETNNLSGLLDYFKNYDLFVVSRCSNKKCTTSITSSSLKIDDFAFKIKPLQIVLEIILLKNKKTTYVVFSRQNLTTVMIADGKNDNEFNMELYPLYKIKKNKEKFINKLNTYIIFS